MVECAIMPVLERWRQEGQKSQVTLGYVVSLSRLWKILLLKTKPNQTKRTGEMDSIKVDLIQAMCGGTRL